MPIGSTVQYVQYVQYVRYSQYVHHVKYVLYSMYSMYGMYSMYICTYVQLYVVLCTLYLGPSICLVPSTYYLVNRL